ncbi:MAG: lipopolysaccharide kinase InaA family protein [Chryseolinea sp.]
MTKIIINPEFEFLGDFLADLPHRFNSLGILLHAHRNIIREDTVKGVRLVVKSFKRIYLPNKIRYTYFYPSKAQRAYDNAHVLLSNGFNTPRPLAYLEIVKRGLIDEMFFVSEYTDFASLEKIHKDPAIATPELLMAFAAFTFSLHRNNIYHVDYNLGNILTNFVNGEYQFALIDNNRMLFKSIGFNEGIGNFVRLGLSSDQLTIIGKEYARLWKVDESIGIRLLFEKKLAQSRKFERNRSMKRALSIFRKQQQR